MNIQQLAALAALLASTAFGSGPATAAVAPASAPAAVPAHPKTYPTSFNCRRATSFADRTVCADAKLAAKDRRVYFLYQNALERDPAGTVEAQSRGAMAARRRCATVECVQRWYARREAVLNRWVQ